MEITVSERIVKKGDKVYRFMYTKNGDKYYDVVLKTEIRPNFFPVIVEFEKEKNGNTVSESEEEGRNGLITITRGKFKAPVYDVVDKQKFYKEL